MWIETSEPAYHGGGFKTADMDEPVEFNDNGAARVSADVGEFLIDNFEHVSERGEGEPDAEEDGDDEAETGDAEDDNE